MLGCVQSAQLAQNLCYVLVPILCHIFTLIKIKSFVLLNLKVWLSLNGMSEPNGFEVRYCKTVSAIYSLSCRKSKFTM